MSNCDEPDPVIIRKNHISKLQSGWKKNDEENQGGTHRIIKCVPIMSRRITVEIITHNTSNATSSNNNYNRVVYGRPAKPGADGDGYPI